MQTEFNKKDLTRLRNASDALSETFVWADTEEGEDYWGEVAENLERIIENYEYNVDGKGKL